MSGSGYLRTSWRPRWHLRFTLETYMDGAAGRYPEMTHCGSSGPALSRQGLSGVRVGSPDGERGEPVDMNIESVNHRIARFSIVKGEVEIGAGEHDDFGPMVRHHAPTSLKKQIPLHRRTGASETLDFRASRMITTT